MTAIANETYPSIKGDITLVDHVSDFKLPSGIKAIRIEGPTKSLNLCVLQSKQIGNCSNNGVSERFKSLELICHPDESYEDFGDDAIVLLHWAPTGTPIVKAVPLSLLLNRSHTMAGGCFVETCDSRFPFMYPVPLHDRVEW